MKDIRPGQHGVGRTIFSGNKIEDFDVEILGVLENLGPKQSIILAKLSGGPLAKTGVMQGMSGSPVYIDGRLVGAVALAFSFATEPIAGIRPIEDMLSAMHGPPFEPGAPKATGAGAPSASMRTGAWTRDLVPVATETQAMSGESKLIPIATPLSFTGFTEATLAHFAPQLRSIGLEPRQGVSSGGHLPPHLGPPGQLRPGDMITVQLLSGDFSMGAEGTVTNVDGNRVYAFGHRFLSVGDTELPFARAEVLTLLPNLSASFKISSAKEWMGTITQDRSASIYGELGRKANTFPMTIEVSGANHNPLTYHMQMVNDRVLSPMILQMAVYSAIDATERTLGLGSISMRGHIDFGDGAQPLRLDNTYAGDFNVPLQASLGVATPLSYLLGAGFDRLQIRNIELSIDGSERKRVLQIDQVSASKKEVRPGEAVDLAVTLTGDNGIEVQRTATYQVPVGAPLGTLQFAVADATYTNLAEFQQLAGAPAKSPTQVVSFLNNLRPNTSAYVRVWRNDPAFQVGGQTLADAPPSLALILSKAPQNAVANPYALGSKIAELVINAGDAVVSGYKSVSVEIVQ